MTVLRWGIPWRALPRVEGWPSGQTCWRRFDEWQRAGVWPRLSSGCSGGWRGGPDRLGAGDRGLDDRAGEKGGAAMGPNPADRGKPSSKLHLCCDGSGAPLSVAVGRRQRQRRRYLLALVDAIPPLRPAAGATGLTGCSPTAATTPTTSAQPARTRHRAADRKKRAAPGKAASATPTSPTAGRSNAPTPGCTTGAASRSAGNAARALPRAPPTRLLNDPLPPTPRRILRPLPGSGCEPGSKSKPGSLGYLLRARRAGRTRYLTINPNPASAKKVPTVGDPLT